MGDALILAGAVAKGAFHAGAIRRLVERGVEFDTIVGTSAGALTAAVLAAGIRAGKVDEAVDRIERLWSDEARANRVFQPSLRSLLRGDGICDIRRTATLLDAAVSGFDEQVRAVRLTLVQTVLRGRDDGRIGDALATTFEQATTFPRQGRWHWEDVRTAALASAAFPLVFAPVEVGGARCADGGLVDNTPVAHAIREGGPDRVWVVTPEPRVEGLGDVHGFFPLGERLAEILVNERLYRDLREAEAVNATLRKVEAVLDRHEASHALRRELHVALGGRRPIEVRPVRPEENLEGNPFAGFFSHRLRVAYVAAGYAAAEAVSP